MARGARTATTIPTAMDDAVLTLQQWLSPSYPAGAFAYAHGLEQAVADGRLDDAPTLEGWLADVIEFGAGWSDAILLHRSSAGDAGANEAAIAFATSAGRLRETREQGRAFARVTSAVWGTNGDALAYPVAVGAAARALSVPPRLACAMYLHAFAGNLVAAAQRLAPIGQTEAMAVLARLAPRCREVAAETEDISLDALAGAAFLSDISAMRHEMKRVKVFRT